MEFQITDRLSFKRFLGLKVKRQGFPDAKTIWKFRETLIQEDVIHALIERLKAANRKQARHRARVEHIFGYLTNSMKAMYIRTIGYARATAKISLTNLTYNMMRRS